MNTWENRPNPSSGCKRALRVCAFLLPVAICPLPNPAEGQYAFLDANGDSTWTSSDRLDSLGAGRIVDVYIITNRNQDASTATCNSGGDDLTINSYVVNLEASGGTVSFSGFTNRQAGMTLVTPAEQSTSTEWKGGRAGGTVLAPGKYRLMSITVTVTSGAPTLSIIPMASISQDPTSFGTACSGLDQDNTYKLGSDWVDVAELAPFGIPLTAPDSIVGSTSTRVWFEVTSDRLLTTLQATGLPNGATFTPIENESRAIVSWVPETQSGTYDIAFKAIATGGVGAETTRVSVVAPTGPRKPWVAGALWDLPVGGRNYERLLDHSSGTVALRTFARGDVSDEALATRGVSVLSRIGNYIAISCPYDSIPRLFDTPGLEAVFEPEFCKLAVDSSMKDVGLDGARCVDFVPLPPLSNVGVVSGQTGAGVVIGVVDSGIDVEHGDFKNFVGHTRIVSYWDQTAEVGSPPGMYGKVYTAAQIDAGAVDASAGDFKGHGTHVAGIAAGNGQGGWPCRDKGKYIGVAPGADLCIVKVRPQYDERINSADIINGIKYVFAKADTLGKPAVVNLSLGNHIGPHDGGSLLDSLMNRVGMGPGHIVVAGAGNEGTEYQNSTHVTMPLRPDVESTTTLVLESDGGPNGFLYLHGWLSNEDRASLQVRTPNNYTSTVVVSPGSDATVTPDAYISCTIGPGVTNPSFWPRDYEYVIKIWGRSGSNSTLPAGNWEFTFIPTVVGGASQVDLYLEDYHLGSTLPLVYFLEGDPASTVRSPADHDSVIAVGAYVTRESWPNRSNVLTTRPGLQHQNLLSYTSRGPRRDGAIKPDLMGPGGMIASSLSKDVPPSVLASVAVYGDSHAVFEGTSMAASHVTGAVALLLAQPGWAAATPTAILERLRSSARTDEFTGGVPNYTWGYGKLNLRPALGTVPRLEVLYPPKGTVVTSRWGRTDILPNGGPFDSILVDLSLDGCAYPKRLANVKGIPSGSPTRVQYAATDTTSKARIRAVGYKANGTIVEAFSDSLFSLNYAQTAGVESDEVPRVFAVHRNRPNPFNPRTAISFDIAEPGDVSVRIYGVDGRLVRDLIDRRIEPGRYTVEWDGTNAEANRVASGVYFYEVTSNGQRSARKMTLLK